MIINLWLHACNVENGNYEMGEHKIRVSCADVFSSLLCVGGGIVDVYFLYM